MDWNIEDEKTAGFFYSSIFTVSYTLHADSGVFVPLTIADCRLVWKATFININFNSQAFYLHLCIYICALSHDSFEDYYTLNMDIQNITIITE